MNLSVEEYRKILGVTENSSTNDIKKAYRKQAKIYHPDRNDNPNAAQVFIALNEAYLYLTENNNRSEINFTTEEETFYEKTEEDYRREEAQKRYEAFTKSDFYKNDLAFLVIFDHFRAFISILSLMLPFVGWFLFKTLGFIIGFFLTLAMVHVWSSAYKNRKSLNLNKLKKALQRVIKIKQTQIVLACFLHIIMFFSHTIKTVIDSYSFILGIFTYSIFSIILARFFITKTERFKISLIFFPFLFNLIFCLNYIFSGNPYTETYRFHHKMMKGTGRHQLEEKSTYIVLEQNQYKNHHYLKFFYDFERMKYKSKITYQFERGLFGFKVVKDYQFNGE